MLNTAQTHRGPDASVVVQEGPFILGNTRLAIQDPSPAANQPFRDPEGHVTVVFNGEIYNFRELIERHHLEVRTGCDGEVIPLLWRRFGPDCLPMLRGMFAIAVVDHLRQRLYLARDPFGIKPLHWRVKDGAVFFASEVKPLWCIDRMPRPRNSALAAFLRFGSVPASMSPFEAIETVEPGACIAFDDACRPIDVLTIPTLVDGRSDTDAPVGSLLDAFRESVRLHLVSDVPTALLLSAGVDSSMIAATASELGQSLHCLTVTGALGADESPQAQATASVYGHTHEEVSASLDEATVVEFFAAMQRPSIDGLNTFLVSRAVKAAGFKVALSGLGGDEALAGYPYARLLHALPLLNAIDHLPRRATGPWLDRVAGRLPGSGSGKSRRLLGPGGPRTPQGLVALQREVLSENELGLLGVSEQAIGAPDPALDHHGYRAMAAAELELYLQPTLLADTDAFSMNASVEMRVPFVDRVFFSQALCRSRFRGKRQLVDAMEDDYLSLLSRRRKTGFSLPMSEWLATGALRATVEDARSPDAPVWDHLDRVAGTALLDGASGGDRFAGPWAIAAVNGWLRSL